MDEATPLTVVVDPADPAHLIVSGELDATTAPVLRAALDACDEDELHLDLSDVAFIDSSGLQAIAAVRRERRAAGRDLRVAGASRSVRRIFEVTGLTELLADG